MATKWKKKPTPPGGKPAQVRFFKCERTTTYGRKWVDPNNVVRVIKENGGWRVDFANAVAGAWLPWEPVTTEAYRTMTEAKKVANRFAAKCKRG